jgi:methyl-accepting chemotaxis protein
MDDPGYRFKRGNNMWSFLSIGGLAVWVWFRFTKKIQSETLCANLTESAKSVEKYSISLKQAAKSVVDISQLQSASIRNLNESTHNLANELTNISEKSGSSGKISSESLNTVSEGEKSLDQLIDELKTLSQEALIAKTEILTNLENLTSASNVIRNISGCRADYSGIPVSNRNDS